jgi:transcriptional regulator with XRE-family HTH domain
MFRDFSTVRDEAIYHVIGRRLRARRRLADLTQAQVAARCGLTFQQIHKYESGSVAMPVARLVQLAAVLQTPLQELIGDLHPSEPRHAAPAFEAVA